MDSNSKMKLPPTLGPREWGQVRAALVFWKSMVKHSRQHPARHPLARKELEQHGPLEVAEIDRLLAGQPACEYITIAEIAKWMGCTDETARRRIQRAGVKPVIRSPVVTLYSSEAVRPVVESYA